MHHKHPRSIKPSEKKSDESLIDEATKLLIKLKNYETYRLNRKNQPIFIQNLMVEYLHRSSSYGEFHDARNQHKATANVGLRLANHIRLLAKIANDHHEKRHFIKTAKGYDFKSEKARNTVTRILLNEFALYTYAKPLSFKELSELLDQIYIIATECHENLHLSLGTIGIQGMDNRLLNYNIYVQCGSNPKINCFAKSNVSGEDPFYSGSYNLSKTPFSQLRFNKKDNSYYSTPHTIAIPDRTQISGSVFYDSHLSCMTAGGHTFTIVSEICLDHEYAHAMVSFEKRIEFIGRGDSMEYLNSHIIHDIISNSIDLNKSNILSHYVTQADSVSSNVYIVNTKQMNHQKMDYSETKHLNTYVTPGAKTEISKVRIDNQDKVMVRNPDFGDDYVISLYSEFKLTKEITPSSISQKIREANERMMHNKILRTVRHSHAFSPNILRQAKIKWEMSMIDELVKQLDLNKTQNAYKQLFLEKMEYWESESLQALLKHTTPLTRRDNGVDIDFPQERYHLSGRRSKL